MKDTRGGLLRPLHIKGRLPIDKSFVQSFVWVLHALALSRQ